MSALPPKAVIRSRAVQRPLLTHIGSRAQKIAGGVGVIALGRKIGRQIGEGI